MLPGYITLGQGCRCGDQWGTIVRHGAEVDGEQFVVVRLCGGEERLVSTLELLPATQVPEVAEETEAEIDEEVVGEVEETTTSEIQTISFKRENELAEDDEEEISEEEEAEVAGES